MTESVKQEHFGTGDNVAGNKIIQSIQAGDFVKVAQELYYLINIGSYEEVKNIIDVINKIPSKAQEIIIFLEVINIYLKAKTSKKNQII